ncbi:MAG: hypothetical protein PHU85_17070 [Phycisphaerae bacterium]|nr:hypothetical protein [Phycisphaerae bacterium]
MSKKSTSKKSTSSDVAAGLQAPFEQLRNAVEAAVTQLREEYGSLDLEFTVDVSSDVPPRLMVATEWSWHTKRPGGHLYDVRETDPASAAIATYIALSRWCDDQISPPAAQPQAAKPEPTTGDVDILNALADRLRAELKRLAGVSPEYHLAVRHFDSAQAQLRRCADEVRFGLRERERADAVLERHRNPQRVAQDAAEVQRLNRRDRRRVIAFARRFGADETDPKAAQVVPAPVTYDNRDAAIKAWQPGAPAYDRLVEGGRFVVDKIVIVPDDDLPLSPSHPLAETVRLRLHDIDDEDPDELDTLPPAPAGDPQAASAS